MKYLTTLEVAQQLAITKQTLLNWLYSGKVSEPPRDRNGYRLWSLSRLTLIRRLIADGRVHRRTVVHREPSRRPELVAEFAREVSQFLRDGEIELQAFWKELSRVHPVGGPARRPVRRPRKAR
jgi:DNA-binding transcriptional MerR regulator